ncbi:hypothetical protein FB451DRAFT_1179136 [Mycena latifolia]|nr:hypothetical protein FB451DRAFT_1179136 [Mycena latifolia]
MYNSPDWAPYWTNSGTIQPSHVPAPMPPYFHPHPYFPPMPLPAITAPYGPYSTPESQTQPPIFSTPSQPWPSQQNPAAMNHHHTSFTALPPAPDPLGGQSSGSRIEAPSYQWPTGDVKLECTFGQEPAGWDDEGWKWRSSGSRKKGVPESATHVDKRTCLGVFHCGCIDECGVPTRFFRPKSAVDARQKQETETCHICRSTLKPVKCAATLTYYRVVDDDGRVKAVRHHVGHHDHARPPLTKLSATEVKALDVQVRQNPEATAQQLRAGAGATQVALGEINPILLNPRKARHEVEKSKLLESFSALNNSFESPWIVASNLLEQQYICMQTPFMRDVLLRDSVQSWHAENLEPESGRHGVITDGTHDFFKHGILLTSLVFSQVLFRWVVVLYTWIGNQDQEHHLPHFKQLVEVIAEICTSGLGFSFDDRVFSAWKILDFSNAQRNGFIDAFVDYICSRIPGWKELSPKSRASERTTLRARAQALLIGCKIVSDAHLFARFKLGEIVMLPYPGASDWRADNVLWYPARFSGRMERSVGTVREFKFKWLECVDWSDHEDPETRFPLLIPRTYQREREFCQDVANTVLKSRQIGKIHLPSYLQPEQSAPLEGRVEGVRSRSRRFKGHGEALVLLSRRVMVYSFLGMFTD